MKNSTTQELELYMVRTGGGVKTHLAPQGKGSNVPALCGYLPVSFQDWPGRARHRWVLGSGHFMCPRCLIAQAKLIIGDAFHARR